MIGILLKNELYKMFKKKKIYVLLGLLVAASIFQVVLSYKYDESKKIDWQASAKAQIEYVDDYMAENKDALEPADSEMLLNQKKLAEFALENNIPSLYICNYWNAVANSLGMMILVTVFSVLVCCDVFCEEYSLKTLKTLFTRPNKRENIWIAKIFASVLIFILFALVVIFISCALNCFFYDCNQKNQVILYFDSGRIVQKAYFVYFLQMFFAGIFEGIGYIFLTAMCAVIFKNASISMTISLLSIFGANALITIFESKTELVKYILFYNNDLSQYLNHATTYWNTSLLFSLIISLAYYFVFLCSSCYVFKKQDVF